MQRTSKNAWHESAGEMLLRLSQPGQKKEQKRLEAMNLASIRHQFKEKLMSPLRFLAQNDDESWQEFRRRVIRRQLTVAAILVLPYAVYVVVAHFLFESTHRLLYAALAIPTDLALMYGTIAFLVVSLQAIEVVSAPIRPQN